LPRNDTYGYKNPIRYYYDPTGHIVTEWDKKNCTKEQISTIEKATKDYNAAKARGDQEGMNAAHAMAVNARAVSGKMRNNQTVNSSGYVVMKTSSTASSSSNSSNRSRSGSGSGSKTSNSIASSIKDNLSLKPLSASASSNHPLINGNEIAEKDTNKISLSEIGDGVFSFISGAAASGVAASLSMGLSDIFVINDDNKNETVYLVGRLTGAVVVATVAIVMTVRSGASAVSTAPTVVGTAVSVASVVDNGSKAISAIGVAGDTINTLIANSKENPTVGAKTTMDYLKYVQKINGNYYAPKNVIDEIGQIEASGVDFSKLKSNVMSSRVSTEGGFSQVIRYTDNDGTKFIIHEVSDNAGKVLHRDFDAVRIQSGQLINKLNK
jgi:hypothetical protein